MEKLMNCKGELELGAQLAKDGNASKAEKAFLSEDYNPQKIIKAAIEDYAGNQDGLVEKVLQGTPWWAYLALRFVPDLNDANRNALIVKAGENPKSAYYTLLKVKNLGDHRSDLLAMSCQDAGWAALTHENISDLGDHKSKLMNMTESAAPTEIGWGYNTYFVNQTGQPVWVMFNTGMRGSSGSITGPLLLKTGQNVGWGRGGACISEARAWFAKPKDWFTQGAGMWDKWGINGCNNWGFLITKVGSFPNIPEADAVTWTSGQLGMPYKYPPSNGS